MTPDIKAIIFDFGGVLLQWDLHRLYHRYFEHRQQIDDFLAEINFSSWNLEQDRGRSFAEGIAELSDRFPQYAHLIRAYYDHFEDTIVGPIGGTVAILRQLKQAGYPLYGLSNWSAETYPRVRRQYDFFGLFDQIILSGEVKLIKPDPAIFNLALQTIKRPAGECLLIDDSEPNTVAARKLGFATIHFKSPEQLRAELRGFKLL
ncbi:MAG TPA: HAD family phosphatase [Anaerolineales bacterium]|nr:HAD family phosphatase [Anaerolineales bacterium]